MGIGERLLLALSRDPGAPDRHPETVPAPDRALDLLRQGFPDFVAALRGARALDFGCGRGAQVVGMALSGASEAVGIDTNEGLLEAGRALAHSAGVAGRTRFAVAPAPGEAGTFDLVVSQNSMEHFPDPRGALSAMRDLLRPGGRLYLTFCPPWYAPYGAHMHFFTAVPWVHLVFPEHTVMAVRSRFRSDGATRYEEVENGLNRMSIAKFERLVRASGLEVESARYVAVKNLAPLASIPLVRELFINRVDCVLRRPVASPTPT